MRHLGITLVCCLAVYVGFRESANLNAEQPSEARQQVLKLEDDWVTAEMNTMRLLFDESWTTNFSAASGRTGLTIRKPSSKMWSQATSILANLRP